MTIFELFFFSLFLTGGYFFIEAIMPVPPDAGFLTRVFPVFYLSALYVIIVRVFCYAVFERNSRPKKQPKPTGEYKETQTEASFKSSEPKNSDGESK